MNPEFNVLWIKNYCLLHIIELLFLHRSVSDAKKFTLVRDLGCIKKQRAGERSKCLPFFGWLSEFELRD